MTGAELEEMDPRWQALIAFVKKGPTDNAVNNQPSHGGAFDSGKDAQNAHHQDGPVSHLTGSPAPHFSNNASVLNMTGPRQRRLGVPGNPASRSSQDGAAFPPQANSQLVGSVNQLSRPNHTPQLGRTQSPPLLGRPRRSSPVAENSGPRPRPPCGHECWSADQIQASGTYRVCRICWNAERQPDT
jgi:hypothetical protein